MKRFLSMVLALGVAFAAAADETTITASANVPEVLTAEGITWGESAIAAGENTLEAPEYAYLKTFSGIRYSCCGYAVSNVVGEVAAGDERSATFTVDVAKGPYTILWKWNARTVLADKTFYANAATGDDGNTGEDAAHPFKTIHAAHVATTNYLAQNGGKTALVSLAEGAYPLTNAMAFVAGERIVGAGMDKTGISLRNCAMTSSDEGYAIKLVSADNLLSSLCVTGRVTSSRGHPIYLAKGRVEYVLSRDHLGGYEGKGMGLYMTDGTAQFCVFRNNTINDMYSRGVGVYMKGGELLDSEMCYNLDSSGRGTINVGGQGLYMTGGTARRCKIHHNNETASGGLGENYGGGAYVYGGVLENSLVYKNGYNGGNKGGGVFLRSGTMRFCTVYGNKCAGDTQGYSGLYQYGGTAINNIIFGNYQAGAIVDGGTCVSNFLDAAVAGRSANFVAENAYLTDPENADFTIAKRSSLAVGNAQPLAAVTTDFAGTTRAATPTIGAYEYDSSKETFEVALQIPKVTNLYGTKVSANAVVSGKGGATIAIDWYVDGVKAPALANLESVEIENLDYGWHSLRVEAAKGTDVKFDEVAKAVTIVSDRVYVNKTGNGTYPYASAATGTNDILVAMGAIWKADDTVSHLDVGEGTYTLTNQLLVSSPIAIEGRGADKTILKGNRVTTRLVVLSNAKARLQDLGVTGTFDFGSAQYPDGAVQLTRGTIDRCRIFDSYLSGYNKKGGGILVEYGTLQNSVITNCHAWSDYAYGGGVAMMYAGGVVSNCLIHTCALRGRTRNGGGAYVERGFLTHCRITHCGNHADPSGAVYGSNGGAAIAVNMGTVRNTLIDDAYSSSDNVAYLCNWSCLESSIVTASRTSTAKPIVWLQSGCTLRNSVVWGNDCGTNVVTSSTVTYSCYPEATEGASGNTARNPKLRARRDYEISPFGSCYRAGAVQSWMTGATDLSGRPRTTTEKGVEKVDIGCHQVPPPKGAAFVVR